MKFSLKFTLMIALSAATLLGQTVDVENSSFTWKATKKIGKSHEGPISLKSANATYEEGQFVKAEFVMDMDSFTVADLEGEWKEKFERHVKSGDFFEVEKYPTATLILDKKEGDTYHGMLTIKDKTNPIQVTATMTDNTYSGTMTFDRTAFGVIYGSGNFFKDLAADRIINNDVTLSFNVVVN